LVFLAYALITESNVPPEKLHPNYVVKFVYHHYGIMVY